MMDPFPAIERSACVSVVVPVHNVAPWIEETLRSLLDQRIVLEILVVDDGSTDATRGLVDGLANADSRLKVLDADQRGGAHARNQGAREAIGEYLAFVDGDDLVPHGAYDPMVRSLDESGSDLAIGDYLKFSASRTWSPTARWPDYQTSRQRIALSDAPSLIRGRACWNRVFRTHFWRRSGLTFPEVPRSNDIVPMTRALTLAKSIDVVDVCMYLYRERPGRSSMTALAGADRAALSYFAQEAECAALVSRVRDGGLSTMYSALIFDSDAWVHLSRYLLSIEGAEALPPGVLQAVDELVSRTPKDALNLAAAHRRMIFALLHAEHRGLALLFNRATTEPSQSSAGDQLDIWLEATRSLLAGPKLDGLDVGKLVNDGLLTAMVNLAHRIEPEHLRQLTLRIANSGVVELGLVRFNMESAVLIAMRSALANRDANAVSDVSTIASETPLIVDRVAPSRSTTQVEGSVPASLAGRILHLVAHSQVTGEMHVLGSIRMNGPRWEASIDLAGVRRGRYEIRAVAHIRPDLPLEVAVVTARISMAPASVWHSQFAMSDRRRSRRLIVERRPAIGNRLIRAVMHRINRPCT